MTTTKPTYKEPEAYKSQYGDQIASGMNKVTNREAFSYDPMKDANYQAMAKIYTQQGNKAAKDTLGDAASLNGGYGSSYAVTASQQVRNDYNQQLASQIPALSEAAYNKYKDAYDMDVTNLQLMQDADDRAYGRHRDSVSDSQWKYGQDYQSYRDDKADEQWKTEYDRSVFESDRSYNYQKDRDAVADKQWADEFAYQKDRDAVADKQWQTTYDRSVYESDRDYEYQQGRDAVADSQWQKSYDRSVYESNRDYNYQKSRDSVADSQWAKEYALAKKNKASSSGSSVSGYIGSSTTSNYTKAKTTASKSSSKSKTTSTGHHSSKNSKKSAVSGRATRNKSAKTANAGRKKK